MGFTSVMADIWRSKSRSALTMSAVAIGIFSVTVISAVGQIGTARINESLDDMGVNSVLVEAQEAGVTLGDNDIKKLGDLSGITGAMPLMAQVTKCELICGKSGEYLRYRRQNSARNIWQDEHSRKDGKREFRRKVYGFYGDRCSRVRAQSYTEYDE